MSNMEKKQITITMMCQYLVWSILVGTFTFFAPAHSKRMCKFPANIQAVEGGQTVREWHGHITRHIQDKSHSYSYIVTFNGPIMKAVVSGGWKMKHQPKPYTRECIRQVDEGKFLVQHKESGLDRDKFCCIQFLLRSGDVLQMKISRLAGKENTNLCSDDNLVLDPWPYVNRVNLFRSYKECPLQGGYNIMIYDKSERRGICDAFFGTTRLESECMAGEGMFFRYRQDVCVPNEIHMHINQRVYCMATWQDGSNTYSVLRHDRNNHQWCFRHPTKIGNGFVAYLFKDLHCENSRNPDPTVDYLQLDMVRDAPQPLSSLCKDDYEACNVWTNPCRHAGSVMSLSCARTCGICGDSRPATCTLPGKLHGKWLDASSVRKEEIRISDMFLSVNSFRQMQCIKWNEGSYFADPNYMEHMFVTTFENGCKPRYQCAHFQRRTTSILRYKLSQSQIWPFDDTTGSLINCRIFNYRDDDPPFLDQWRSRHFKVLVSMSERRYVPCNLHESKDFTVTYDDGIVCNGTILNDINTKTKLTLRLRRCYGHEAEQEFACLDSWKHGYLSDQMIVTESLDYSNELRCWLIPTTPPDTFYLLPSSQCNEGSKDKIVGGQIIPIATFKVHRPKFPFGVEEQHKNQHDPAAPDDELGDGNSQTVNEVEIVKKEEQRDSRHSPNEVEVKAKSHTAGVAALSFSLWPCFIIITCITLTQNWR